MHLSRTEFDKMDAQMFEIFIGHGIEEGTYLDYKRTITRPLSNDAKKELLKDVSGFANAGGGLLIYGCDEPAANVSITDQIVGVQDGPSLAGDIERVLNDLLDPRIPGLAVKHIALSNTSHVLLVFIPPSNIRPHMVTFNKRNQFYMRHSESTEIMNAEEVKSAVLSAYSRDETIELMYNEVMRKFNASRFNNKNSCIVMQAIPLTEPVGRWDVFGNDVQNVLFGLNKRRDFHSEFRLETGFRTRIDVDEISSSDCYDEPLKWRFAVKSNGHVYLFMNIFYTENLTYEDREANTYQYFSSYWNQLFCVFGVLVDELLFVTNSSHGYQIRTTVANTQELVLYRNGDYGDGGFQAPLGRDAIDVPTQVSLPGSSVEKTCEIIGNYIYQAFGVLPRDSELKVRGDLPGR